MIAFPSQAIVIPQHHCYVVTRSLCIRKQYHTQQWGRKLVCEETIMGIVQGSRVIISIVCHYM